MRQRFGRCESLIAKAPVESIHPKHRDVSDTVGIHADYPEQVIELLTMSPGLHQS